MVLLMRHHHQKSVQVVDMVVGVLVLLEVVVVSLVFLMVKLQL